MRAALELLRTLMHAAASLEVAWLRPHGRLWTIEGWALRLRAALELLRTLVHAAASVEVAGLRSHGRLGATEGRALRLRTTNISRRFSAVRIAALVAAVTAEVAVAWSLRAFTLGPRPGVALPPGVAIGIFGEAGHAELVGRDFSIAVAIHFTECFGRFIDFSGIDGAVMVCVEHAEHADGGTLHGCGLGL